VFSLVMCYDEMQEIEHSRSQVNTMKDKSIMHVQQNSRLDLICFENNCESPRLICNKSLFDFFI
jgi:hypothetical protein